MIAVASLLHLEKSILNRCVHFHGRRALLIVVGHVIDPHAHWTASSRRDDLNFFWFMAFFVPALVRAGFVAETLTAAIVRLVEARSTYPEHASWSLALHSRDFVEFMLGVGLLKIVE
jgi:hypothetical protein